MCKPILYAASSDLLYSILVLFCSWVTQHNPYFFQGGNAGEFSKIFETPSPKPFSFSSQRCPTCKNDELFSWSPETDAQGAPHDGTPADCFTQTTNTHLHSSFLGSRTLSLWRVNGNRLGWEDSLNISLLLTTAASFQPFNTPIKQPVGLAAADAGNRHTFLSDLPALHLQQKGHMGLKTLCCSFCHKRGRTYVLTKNNYAKYSCAATPQLLQRQKHDRPAECQTVRRAGLIWGNNVHLPSKNQFHCKHRPN